MLSATSPLSLDYQALREAAECLGFRNEANLIARRLDRLDAPFTITVVGTPGAGKSTVLNLLLGRELAGGTAVGGWLNVYRAAPHRYEYAEIYRAGDTAPQRLPVPEAQRLTAALSADEAAAVEQIIWRVHAPAVPDHIALLEVPADAEGRVPLTYSWEADALVWVLRADQWAQPEARRLLAAHRAIHTTATPSLAVVTHMDQVPKARWLPLLDRIRRGPAAHLDHIVPAAFPPDTAGDAVTTAPVYREIRNRFFSGTHLSRLQRHRQFADALRATMAQRFEQQVDAILADAWTCRHLPDQVGDAVRAVTPTVLAEGDALLGSFRTQPLCPDLSASEPGLIPVDVFFRRTRDAVLRAAEDAAAPAAAFVTRAATCSLREALERAASTPPPRLPFYAAGGDPKAFRAVADTDLAAVATDDSLRTARFDELIAKAQAALVQWMEQLTKAITAEVVTLAREAFHQAHGFRPSKAAAVLQTREEAYARLTESDLLTVPSPHRPDLALSPAAFLLEAQGHDFIAAWNQALLDASFERVAGRLAGHAERLLDGLRDDLRAAWRAQRPAVQTMVRDRLRQHRWSRWTATHWETSVLLQTLPAALTDVTVAFEKRWSTRPAAAAPNGRSLYLDLQTAAFLMPPPEHPRADDRPPLAFVVAQELQRAARAHADETQAWPAEITVAASMPKAVAIGLGLGVGAALLIAALLVTSLGVGPASIVGTLSAWTGIGAGLRHLMRRHTTSWLRQRSKDAPAHLMQDVDRLLTARVDALREALLDALRSEALHDAVGAVMARYEAPPAAAYLPYGELVRRLGGRSEPTSSRLPTATPPPGTPPRSVAA